MTDEEVENLRCRLVDRVQVARFRYERVKEQYVKGDATATELLNLREILDETEAELRAHEEVYGKR